jgi:transcription elongation GreA/GreB family factor
MDKKVWITAEGCQQLQARLNELRTRRPTYVEDLQDVSGEADWRESAQVTLMVHELAQVDAEIHKLEEILAYGEIAEPQKADAVVDVGETVVLQIDGDVETYTIVSPAESAPELGRISYESPLGHSLLKRKVGDDETIKVPAGLLHYRILALR